MDLFLKQLKDPAAIKKLSTSELEVLAWSIRDRIIDVMSKNGGHLSSNLGAIELTIALHKVFDSPKDKFIFDTSHQTYTHKILTGRDGRFDTVRKYQGLSGFTSPEESPHDHFFAGHAGTALSLALGVVKTRDLNQETFYVLPVVGDAAFTCGLTHEALNNIPKDLQNLVIILNDNAMSISKNVGAITDILRSFLPHSTSKKIFSHMENALKKICACQTSASRTQEEHKDPWEDLIDTAPFFEQYGLEYTGPIDGHNIETLIATFEKVKTKKGPQIIHVLTNKGHGMEQASKNPTCYHGVRPFEKVTGIFLPQPAKPTFPKVFGEHMLALAKQHPELVTLTPAMPVGSCLVELMDEFPERCLDVGIAEGHCVTFAGGLALDRTKKVVVSIYATFLQRALDNLFQDVCLQKAPVIFALDRAGLAGGDGATHNGIYDIGFLKGMPNLLIAQPRSGTVLKELLSSALDYSDPIAIRYPNLATENTLQPLQIRQVGKAEVIVEGKDVAIIALGHLIQTAIETRHLLEKEQIFPTIVDPIFIKPLDQHLFRDIFENHSIIITLEEHALSSGFGEIINSFAAQHGYQHVQLINLGIPDRFVEQGSHAELLKELHLDPLSISKKIMSCFSLETLG